MFKGSKTILKEKVMESLRSTLPIVAIVFLLCFTFVPISNNVLMLFVIGSILLILGMGLFTLGTDLSMTPIGGYVGASVVKSRKVWLLIVVSFLVGCMVTVSEPDLQVLAGQVPNIPNLVLILSVALGVGIFLVFAILRILFRIKLQYLLMAFYGIVIALSFFIPKSFLAVAFDSGGVTTGPMTVPFIMALGVGISSIRSDENAENDSFGLVALCSVGPILAVMILGLIYNPTESSAITETLQNPESSTELAGMFLHGFPEYFKEVAFALLPIFLFFLVFQIFSLHLNKENLLRITVGLVYTYLGLVLFLTGANIGFMPVGTLLGSTIGSMEIRWIAVPIGMIIGYFIVTAEPAVHVLTKQVYEMTSGMVSERSMQLSLSVGVSVSIGLSILRILLGIPIMYLIVPGYLLALVLSFFVPPVFTAIAFDSGGVASGPMTAAFSLPLAMGVCNACGGNPVTDAFGVVAMVAMTPLITIQLLGLVYRLKASEKRASTVEPLPDLPPDEIIRMEDNE